MTARNMLLFLLVLLGTGAIFGGGALIASPQGSWLGMPLSMLANSPFKTFLIPGIILFIILGLAPIGVVFALVKRPKNRLAEQLNLYKDMYWGWTYCIYLAFAVIIWIQIQMVFLRAVHWAHTAYMLFSLVIIFVALLPQVRNAYKMDLLKRV